MISGIDLNETIDYSSKFDTTDQKTIFKIGAIPSRVQARVGRIIGDGSGSLEGIMEAFRFGVKNIINLSNKHGVPVQFETSSFVIDGTVYQLVSNKILDILPLKIISDVGAKIMDLSKMSEEEEKN